MASQHDIAVKVRAMPLEKGPSDIEGIMIDQIKKREADEINAKKAKNPQIYELVSQDEKEKDKEKDKEKERKT